MNSRWGAAAALVVLCAAPCLDADLSFGDSASPASGVLELRDRDRGSAFPAVGKMFGAARSASPVVLSARSPCLLSDVSSDAISDTANIDVLGGLVRSRIGSLAPKRSAWAKRSSDRWLDFKDARRAVRSLAHTRRSDFWEW